MQLEIGKLYRTIVSLSSNNICNEQFVYIPKNTVFMFVKLEAKEDWRFNYFHILLNNEILRIPVEKNKIIKRYFEQC
jgi:hypothetical protein